MCTCHSINPKTILRFIQFKQKIPKNVQLEKTPFFLLEKVQHGNKNHENLSISTYLCHGSKLQRLLKNCIIPNNLILCKIGSSTPSNTSHVHKMALYSHQRCVHSLKICLLINKKTFVTLKQTKLVFSRFRIYLYYTILHYITFTN